MQASNRLCLPSGIDQRDGKKHKPTLKKSLYSRPERELLTSARSEPFVPQRHVVLHPAWLPEP